MNPKPNCQSAEADPVADFFGEEPSAKLAEGGESRDRVASFVGIGRTSLTKATAIVEAAEAEPKKFAPREREAAAERQRTLNNPSPVGRPRNEMVESCPNYERGKTRDKVAVYAGTSGRTLDKITTVMRAAEAEPERFAPLVAEMDRTGSSLSPACHVPCLTRAGPRPV